MALFKKGSKVSDLDTDLSLTGEKLKLSELSLFCYHMELILKSGIPMVEGIQLLTDEVGDKRIKKAFEVMYEDIKNGMDFHSALAKHSIFPSYMVNMVKIGVETGTLDNVMTHLSKYYEKEEKLNRRIISAVTYPAILLILMTGVILLLILKILPMFNDILNSVGGDMPTVTKIMLTISLAIKKYILIIVVVVIAIVSAIYFYIHTTGGRKMFDKFKVQFPPTKMIYKKIIASRFSMGMSLILKSGLDSVVALSMVQSIIGNT